MKIGELEAHHDAFVESERDIHELLQTGQLPGALSACVTSFPHIVPAIRFRKKRGIVPEMPELLAFNTICRYAPLLFEHAAIESLLEFVNSSRVLTTSMRHLLDSINAALEREELARLLWNHIERHPGILQRDIHAQLGADREDVDGIVESWEGLGILDRRTQDGTYRLDLRTRLGDEVEGLCLGCGVRGRGRRELFFRSATCQKCGAEGFYHVTYQELV